MPDEDRDTEVDELETVDETEETEAEVEETEEEVETEADADPSDDDVEVEAEAEDADTEAHRKPSRAENTRRRAQRAETEAQRLREENARLTGRLEATGTSRQTGPSADEQAREREYLATLTPEERADYRVAQAERRLEARLGQTQFTLADQTDKAAFDAKAETDPVYRRYAAKVESELSRMRKEHNLNVPRQRLLENLIGQDALKKRGEATTRQTRKAAATRQRETTQPRSGARSDAATTRSKGGGKSARDRLTDVTF